MQLPPKMTAGETAFSTALQSSFLIDTELISANERHTYVLQPAMRPRQLDDRLASKLLVPRLQTTWT